MFNTVFTPELDPLHYNTNLFDQKIVQDIWHEKYRLDGEKHPYESMQRVVNAVYKNDPIQAAKTSAYEAMRAGLWLPGGRINAGAGSDKRVTLMNCFVNATVYDSMDGIATALRYISLTLQQGGGIGTDFSTLRPRKAKLRQLGGGAFASGPVSYMYVWDSMCRTIMSAGARRGAMMGTLICTHPDLVEFIQAKRTQGTLTMFNMSVLVTDAFIDAVKEDQIWAFFFPIEPYDDSQEGNFVDHEGVTQYIYSTIPARELWDMIMRNTYEYSEPGIIFIDRINAWNNLYYCEEIMCTNPCVTGDTLILTDQGHLPIQSLVGKQISIWNGDQWSEVTPFSTGVNKLLEVKFSNGASIRCTLNHEWILANGDTCKASNLIVGDKLIYKEMPFISEPIGENPVIDAYSQGFYSGDGTKNSDNSNLYKHEEGIRNRLIGKVYNRNCVDQPGYRWVHGKMLPKDFVPLTTSYLYCINWLAGYLDADGCVVKKGKSYVIEASTKDRDFLLNIGLMLNRLGVNYRIWERKDGGIKLGSNSKEYMCKNTAGLMINWKGCNKLVQLGMVSERVNLEPFKVAPRGAARVGHRVVNITKCNYKEETFCFTEEHNHMGIFNGVPGGQCGEQPLPPHACCNLGAINLARLVKDPFTPNARFDLDTLQQLTYIGVRFLDNVIDITRYPLPEQEEYEKNTRRLGLGVTGLANAFDQMGYRYGDSNSISLTEEIMCCIAQNAYRASVVLARERGSFPLYNQDKFLNSHFIRERLVRERRQEIEQHGIRNGVLLTVAPVGTGSIYYGYSSSGLEPVFRHTTNRKVLQDDGSHEEYTAEDYGYAIWKKVDYHSTLPEHMVTAKDLSVADHLLIQAACQRWVDASVSKTINCPEGISFEEFEGLYRKAYEIGCKGCTTYIPSATRGSILSDAVVSEEPSSGVGITIPIDSSSGKFKPDYKALQEALDSAAEEVTGTVTSRVSGKVTHKAALPRTNLVKLPPRPSVLTGKTYKIKWPSMESSVYVTINDRDGRPCEIFISSTSAKYGEWTTALTRMISAVMRLEIDINFIPQELKQVTSSHDGQWIKGKYYSSMVAYLGKIIEDHIAGLDNHVSVEVEALQKTREAIAESDLAEICTRCAAPAFVHQEGCGICLACGYSTCG